MLKLNSILLFSDDPAKLADFYQKLLIMEPGWKQDDYYGFDAGGIYLMIGPHEKVHGQSQNPERILLNFETEDVESVFTRVKGLGAKVIKEPYHPGEDPNGMIATFADPDGNYFQLVTPMQMG